MRSASLTATLLFGCACLIGTSCQEQAPAAETGSAQAEPVQLPSDATPSAIPTSETDPAAVSESSSAVKTSEAEPVNDRYMANANVEFVRAVQSSDGTWTFHVTVSHPDAGWEDYADGWDVLLPDGTVLKNDASDPFTRLLLHPHENEQPFTRSQGGILIPEGTDRVTVRAHDLIHGFGGNEVQIDLAADSGIDYEIVRP